MAGAARQRGILPLVKKGEIMYELLTKQSEIIESLVWLDKKLLNLLSQYIAIDEYESMLDDVLEGVDVVMD